MTGSNTTMISILGCVSQKADPQKIRKAVNRANKKQKLFVLPFFRTKRARARAALPRTVHKFVVVFCLPCLCALFHEEVKGKSQALSLS
jgi:hypothetical protein